MKYKRHSAFLLLGFFFGFFFGFLAGCSHVNDLERIPASIKDVGVIGPDGEVIFYAKDGDFIIVKACDPHTISGITPEMARSNCQGKSNKIPIESFKQSFRNLVSTARMNALLPLIPPEVEANHHDDPNFDPIQAITIDLKKINNFILVYGQEDARLIQKEDLLKALHSQETFDNALTKIDSEIEKTLTIISNQTQMTLNRFNTDQDQIFHTVLKQFNPNQRFPCGLKGSVDERIKDCSYQLTSENEGFILVTRLNNFKEVYKETKTGLLWSDRLLNKMNRYNAQKVCKADLEEFADLSNVKWRLPSIDEYHEAQKNGISKELPNMNHWFWSSSVHRSHSKDAWLFNGVNGHSISLYRGYHSVRCVGIESTKSVI